jgi:2-oxo-3-hexenedioate decarboxylase
MSDPDVHALAQEMLAAYNSGAIRLVPPSTSREDFDLNAAYAVEDEFARLRREGGRRTVGLKVGYANKAMWRVLKLETLVWAHMYDDTVHYAGGDSAELQLPYDRSSKIEPEIVFKLKRPITQAGMDAVAVLENVEWIAVGFEIIDCPYPEWQFKAADFVAAYGLHLALVVGQPLPVQPEVISTLVSGLAGFKVRISKDGQFIEEGSGKNSLRSPALCVAELGGAVLRRLGCAPLSAGDLVSTGTLTTGHPIARGETWSVEVDGLPVSGLTLRLV